MEDSQTIGKAGLARSWGGQAGLIVAGLLPLLLLGVIVSLVVLTGAGLTAKPVAPLESLTIQRIVLQRNLMQVSVVNGGPADVTLAQVMIDDAVWQAVAKPSASIPRLGQATVEVPYPWVEGERHVVKIITANGLIFSGEVPVAALSPQRTAGAAINLGLLGVYVGVIPVGLGLLWFPFLRRLSQGGMRFILSLTVGLLIFLAADTILEALEIAGRLPGAFQGTPLVLFITLLAFLILLAIGARRGGEQSRLAVAYMIALGIGLHNLGEGLAIGAAFALGEAALGTFLVIGFTLHNITEGVGIGAPVAKERPALSHFVRLALLAGAPAIIGTLVGGYAYSDLAAVVFLSLGAGAILQVIVEVGRLLSRDTQAGKQPLLSPAALAGLASGIGLMYATALLVKF